MKIKRDLSLNILIYILLLFTIILSIILFNKSQFQLYHILEKQVNSNFIYNVQKTDSHQKISAENLVNQYNTEKKRVNKIYQIEFTITIIYAIFGFIFIVISIHQKLTLIENSLNQGIDSLENLELIQNNTKYKEIKKINLKLNTAIHSISEQNKIQTELYENMIHDFSTPLHILKGNLELLNLGLKVDPKTLSNQVERLVYLSKINISQKSTKYTNISSNKIENYILQLQKIYPKNNISPNIEPNILFSTKEENFYRIIDNIVNNAVTHGEATLITISLFSENQNIILSITNNGKQINDDIISILFTRNTSKNSSGIGLNIVSEILDDLKYTINVHSTSQQTNFNIKIPKKITNN